MKTFSQIKIGDHLTNNCIDILITSKTAKFINGYSLLKFRTTGVIEMNTIYIGSFSNRLIMKDLKVTTPKNNIASEEQLNVKFKTTQSDLSSIEIY